MSTIPRVLRWGVICDATTLASWQASCLSALLADPRCVPAIVVLDAAERAWESRPPPGFWDRYRKHALERSAALSPVDMELALADIPVMARPCAGPLLREEIEAIRARDLDFLLDLSSHGVEGTIASVPRYGVWAFQHGGPDNHPTAPHLREIGRGDAVTPVALKRLGAHGAPAELLVEGFFPIMLYSYVGTLDHAFGGSARFPALVCEDILQTGAPRARSRSAAAGPNPVPAESSLLGAHLGRMLWRGAKSRYNWGLRKEQWTIGVVDAPAAAFLDPSFKPDVRWLPTYARGRYLADPFAVKHQGELTILAEEFDHGTDRGHISFVIDREKGAPPVPDAVIAEPNHMSYPYLLTYQGEVHCIPEASTTRTVRLFRAKRFPHEWEVVAVLLRDFAAVDATVFEHDGRWWLFCVDGDTGAWTTLYAFHAPDLLGPWEPHAGNPLKIDARSARPGGRPFVSGGQLYRPAQDCSHGYGGALAINKVLRLTPTEFEEEVVRVIRPDTEGPFPVGLHTLCEVDGVTLIDGRRMIFIGEVLGRSLRDGYDRVLGRSAPR